VDYPQQLRLSLPERNKFEPLQAAFESLTRGLGTFALAAILIVGGVNSPLAQPRSPGPLGAEQGAMRQQLWLVPSQDRSVLMRTTLFRPSGPGPFPLVIINHGSTENEFKRAELRQPNFPAATEWFLARGYAVAVPQRPGHGETGGPYFESNSGDNRCANSDYRASGLATADSIQAALDYLLQQPFVKKTGVIVAGQSAGGWGALALASRNPRSVIAILNFAGGRGGRIGDRANNNCMPDRLIEAARAFGASARIPVLSIYAENDTFFGPAISKKLNEAFRVAGGRVEFHLLPPFGLDGHALFGARDGVPIWGPIVAEFLKSAQ
jgi:dienelactone hydrolase